MTIRFALFCLLILAVPAEALEGDLNGDGVVNFDDYFLFADNFGQSGTPEAAAKAAQTTPERPPEHTTWTSVVAEIEKATYWLGYTAKPQGSSRYYVTFVGTGFAVDRSTIATNYHVARHIDQQIKTILSWLEPAFIAVRANSRVFGPHTYYLGRINEERNLMGFWHPGYNSTPLSPDMAIFYAYDTRTDELAGDLEFVRLASLRDAMQVRPGDEIGILGFPGVLERNHSSYNLNPIATFKRGTISALRAFDDSRSLDRNWKRALMGQFIQHDLDTAPGNSGSPLFNKRAEVIAIHNSGILGGDALDFGIRADVLRLFIMALYSGIDHVNAKPVAGQGLYPVLPHPRPR